MSKVKVITIEQIEAEEELWKTIHEMLLLAEKIVVSKMGEFNDINFTSLSEIKELINIARHKSYERWHSVNLAVKHIETGTTKNQS